MKKILVKAGLIKVSRTSKPNTGDTIIKGLTNNPNFPATEVATLKTNLTTATDVLRSANVSAESGNHEMVAEAKAAERVFDNAVTAVTYYVQGKADANPNDAEAIIKSSGLEVRKTPSPAPAPEVVKQIDAIFTNQPGKILLKWKMPKYATQTYVYMTSTPDKADSWVLVNSLQGRKLLVENLASGTRYYFRVEVANRKNEKSGISDIASTVAA